MNKRFSRGFTLIEILVVVSIFGLISSVALANLQTARQRAEVAAGQQFHATVERSLGVDEIGKWEFDEGLGGTAIDSSGNNRDGTVVGATYVTSGISGSALSFDGNDYIAGTNFPNPGVNGQLTITAWIRPNNISTNNTLFQAGGTTCTTVAVGVAGGKTYSTMIEGVDQVSAQITDDESEENPFQYTQTAVSENRTVVNSLWQNVAFVYNAGLLETFINGTKKSIAKMQIANCDDDNWSIGSSLSSSGFGYGFQGSVDSVRIFGTALTASEINKIYAMGTDTHKNPVVTK